MQLTLVLPNLLDAPPAALAAVNAPALARLLSTAEAPILEPDGPLAIACANIGIAKQNDWPVAPWLARAAGIDPGGRYWLCAAPVTLDVGRVEVRLAGVVSDLDAAEGIALLSSLRAQFASDGIEFLDGGPGRWWVTLAEPQQLETSPPDAVLGKPLIAHLPRGADAARWRRWQSEIQMLLFEHPVNRLREESGQLPVNDVWMWGGGTLRAADPAAPIAAVFTQTPLLRDLARAVGANPVTVPSSFAAFRRAPPAASALVWLDALNALDPQEQLIAFDTNWAAPLERALDKHELELKLVFAGSGTALCFTPHASGAMQRLRRRWSPPPSLSALLAALADA
jgi:hypothetical protein